MCFTSKDSIQAYACGTVSAVILLCVARHHKDVHSRRDWAVFALFLLYATQMQMIDFLLYKCINEPHRMQMNRLVTTVGGLLLASQPLVFLVLVRLVYQRRINTWLIWITCLHAITSLDLLVCSWGSHTSARREGNKCFPDWNWHRNRGRVATLNGYTHLTILTAAGGMFFQTIQARVTYVLLCFGMYLTSYAKYRHIDVGRFWCYLVPLMAPFVALVSVWSVRSHHHQQGPE